MGLSSRTLLLVLVLTLVAILSAPSLSSSTTFAVSAQPQATQEHLQKKVSRLQAKAAKNKGIVELDAQAFEEVMSKPRNYSMAVLNFDPEYKLVASGWSRLADKSQLFFGVLDFKVGQAIFQKFGMNSAPSVLYFPASDAMSSQPNLDRYDFAKNGFQAETFAEWLNGRAGTNVKVRRPFDFVAFAVKVLGVALAVGTAILLYTKAGKISSSKYLWSAISMFTIFIMISGHMWNQIRNPPYTVPGRDGRPGFIAQGFQNQFGLETQLVAVIYAVLTGSGLEGTMCYYQLQLQNRQQYPHDPHPQLLQTSLLMDFTVTATVIGTEAVGVGATDLIRRVTSMAKRRQIYHRNAYSADLGSASFSGSDDDMELDELEDTRR
ncbi:oligosaccharyl transferase subunit ost3/OST6 [Dissophora ornata]|nr:oligosaccharyl transferase subunit ost3/OST6 [Dissophora ornata]